MERSEREEEQESVKEEQINALCQGNLRFMVTLRKPGEKLIPKLSLKIDCDIFMLTGRPFISQTMFLAV